MLKSLCGKQFGCISRAIDMLCIFIGDDYTYINQSGRKIDVSEFALHFQTQWRFIDGNSIILGSRDIYEPFNQAVPDDWKYDIIGRKDEESSIFDVKAKKLNSFMKNTTIAEATVSVFGDVIIVFSNGIKFQSFTPISYKEELWRLIDYKADVHTVVYDVEE